MFVIYHIDTTIVPKFRPGVSVGLETYKSSAAATRALNKAAKDGLINKIDYDILPYNTFRDTVEKTVERVNLMTGKTFRQPVNTPACCDPSTERYWSM